MAYPGRNTITLSEDAIQSAMVDIIKGMLNMGGLPTRITRAELERYPTRFVFESTTDPADEPKAE